jgi:hypothetical protein
MAISIAQGHHRHPERTTGSLPLSIRKAGGPAGLHICLGDNRVLPAPSGTVKIITRVGVL